MSPAGVPDSGLESFLDAASAGAAPDLFRLDGATDGDRERGNQHCVLLRHLQARSFWGLAVCGGAHSRRGA
jgi:hypothetical protein